MAVVPACPWVLQDLAERKMAQLLQYVLERDGDVGVTALEVRGGRPAQCRRA